MRRRCAHPESLCSGCGLTSGSVSGSAGLGERTRSGSPLLHASKDGDGGGGLVLSGVPCGILPGARPSRSPGSGLEVRWPAGGDTGPAGLQSLPRRRSGLDECIQQIQAAVQSLVDDATAMDVRGAGGGVIPLR